MLNNKISDYKTINNVIAIFSGLSAIILVLAPNTVANVFNVNYLSQADGSWINSTRVVAIVCVSLSLLASWARYIDEVYAQKVIMRFYSIMFLGFSYFFREPKKFEGGELFFPKYDYKFDCPNNSLIMMPGWVEHGVSIVSISDSDYFDGFGSYAITSFFGIKEKSK